MPTTNPAASSGFKSEQIEARVKAETAFRVSCSKLGLAEAANVRPGGTVRQLHEGRKLVRQALNKIHADRGDMSTWSADDHAAFDHGASLIASIESMLDDADRDTARQTQGEQWRDAEGRPLNVLRTAEQIRAHYELRAQESGASEHISLTDFFRGVAGHKTTSAVRNALSVGTDTAGGFSVPSLVMPTILEALVPASSLLSAGAGIVPMNEGAKSVTTAAINALPTAAWRAENGAVSESDPTFRGVVATPRSLAFLFKVSRELLADSPNIEAALRTAIAQAFAKELDRAGLRGSGTAPEPRGILNTSGIQAVTNGANGAALASYANLFSAAQAILQADAPMPTAAIMSPRSLVKLGGLLDTTNQPLRVPPMLEKMQYLSTSQIPNNLTVGTSSDCSEIYVGDFTRLAFMMREQMSVQLLVERYSDAGQVGFLCHVRADVILQYPAAFSVVTGVRP
ncbi:MAG: phage major capsid protein [Rhizobacter sp.]|nr:phage major capsid protein [Rhizobacter sp.]